MNAPAVFTTDEIRVLEERGAKAIAGGATLMERAGAATARAAVALAPDSGAPLLVVAGPGNNGGDAWVAAARLRESFHRVVVHDAAGASPRAPEARAAVARFLELGGRTVPEWPADLGPGLVIDGLFGIGLVRDVEGPHAALVGRINACGAPVLSIDIPSGIASDTGRVRGVAVRATRTITFIARKCGLYMSDALDHTGAIEVDELGLPPAFFEGTRGTLLTPEAVRDWLAPRARHGHARSAGPWRSDQGEDSCRAARGTLHLGRAGNEDRAGCRHGIEPGHALHAPAVGRQPPIVHGKVLGLPKVQGERVDADAHRLAAVHQHGNGLGMEAG